MGAIFLDEKDSDLLPVIRTLPLSVSFFLVYRLCFLLLYTFGFGLIMASASNLVAWGVIDSLLFALLYALPAPLIMLVIITFAGNKVEGLAYFKGINFVYLLPLAAFFMEGPWRHAFGVMPMHWSYQFIDGMAAEEWEWWAFALALGIHLLGISYFMYRFRKEVL